MNKFTKPVQYSGKQLLAELNAGGVSIPDGDFAMIDGDGNFWLPVKDKDVAKAEAIVAAHIGVDISIDVAARRQDILNRLGITAEEAAIILG